MALPTFTGTGKFGVEGAAGSSPEPLPGPASPPLVAVDFGAVLPDALAEAEAEAEGEPDGEADALGEAEAEADALGDAEPPVTSLSPCAAAPVGAAAAEPAGSSPPPQADTSDITPTRARADGNLREERSTG
ncbi:hypothetical protein ACH46N_21460 [Streptomyces pristinaespiralis]|uniref:hypothetical protein n=1 Tax=Streptomyces pristinaespiralis TaxID=38300 RepID=UPI001F3AB331|nr:hypothetical protein [Streptomyces pristinaespiralis]